MALPEIIGTVGATLTTVSLLPQAIKLYRTKSARDLSFWTYITLTVGTALWIVYGFMLSAPPIYISNIVCFALAIIILVLKFKHN